MHLPTDKTNPSSLVLSSRLYASIRSSARERAGGAHVCRAGFDRRACAAAPRRGSRPGHARLGGTREFVTFLAHGARARFLLRSGQIRGACPTSFVTHDLPPATAPIPRLPSITMIQFQPMLLPIDPHKNSSAVCGRLRRAVCSKLPLVCSALYRLNHFATLAFHHAGSGCSWS